MVIYMLEEWYERGKTQGSGIPKWDTLLLMYPPLVYLTCQCTSRDSHVTWLADSQLISDEKAPYKKPGPLQPSQNVWWN